MKLFFVFFICCLSTFGFAQLSDDFTDGDFTANPVWTGSTTEFTVNASQRLQLNNSVAATSYLSAPHGLSTLDDQEWRIWVQQTFAPSGSNFGRVYLTSDNVDPALALNGYYLQFGEANATDAIRLFKLENGTSTQICAGTDGDISASFQVSVRVRRSAIGDWTIEADFTGGNTYSVLATANDGTSLLGTHFSVLCTYTASNSTKFSYDNIYAGNQVIDNTPPAISSVTVISNTQVDVLFSEPVEQTSAENTGNYSLNPANTLSAALRDVANTSLVHLTFNTAFGDGVLQTLTCNGIQDLATNPCNNAQGTFTWFAPVSAQAGDVIINEFFCDPTPRIGLAEYEFVEIYNKSNKTLDLNGWKLGDASGDGTVGAGTIAPGEYRVLCTAAAKDSFPNTISVTGFPSLNNSGDDIVLKDAAGIIIDQLTFDLSWYQDPAKESGGFTIELINPNNFCAGSKNWMGSTAAAGGTPGAQNAVFNLNPDITPPGIVSIEVLPPNFISITFSEKMDSLSLMNMLVNITPTLQVTARFVSESYPLSVLLELDQNPAPSVLYALSLTNVSDCSQNQTTLSGEFVITLAPEAGDLVINEILPDPYTNGSDFIELYNRSQKLINLNGLTLANFDNDTIANAKIIGVSKLIKPGEYVVISPDSSSQKTFYPQAVPGTFIQMSLPTYPSDSGTVYLLSGSTIVDKVSYSDEWHFALLSTPDGKSLERMDVNGPSQQASNWHTAAEAVGFATPGRVNSQLLYGEDQGVIALTNDVFSPDNDGFQDVLQLRFEMINPAMVASAQVFDDRGRVVRKLVQAEYIGNEGSITWDGITEDKQKAGIGIYVLYFEAFDESGSRIVKKLPFALAGKF